MSLTELTLILINLFNACVIYKYHLKQFKKAQTVRIMFRASHKDTDKRRINQVNKNSKLKSEVYEMRRLYVQREDER